MIIGLMQNKESIESLSRIWNILPFSKVIKDRSGGNLKIKKADVLEKGLVPVIDQGQDFIAGYTNEENAKVKTSLPLIVFGDHTRILKYIDFDFAMGADGTKVLEVINANPKFIYYYLQSIDIENTGYNRHFKYVKDLVFPIPPLKTQEHIASILDDAAALRDKTAQLLEEYDLLAQSIFLDLMKSLDGEKKSLSEISKINPRKSEIAKVPKDTVVTFLPMSSVSEKGEVELSDERTIKEVWTGYTYFSEDDVLFAKITPCMENGKSCIAKNLNNSIGFGSTEFHVLRPIEGVTNSEWLYNLIKTDRFKYIAEANMRGSAGQKRVPTDFFSKFKIRVPSIELQNEFAEKIALIEQQKDLARQELKESEDLFNCLLQKAFKGELAPESQEA